MSGGLCCPQSFESAFDGGVCYGYVVAATPDQAVQIAGGLYWVGCSYIFADAPTRHAAGRTGWQRLCNIAREGDRIVVASLKSLGTRKTTQQTKIATLGDKGVGVFVLTENGSPKNQIHEQIQEVRV